TGVAEPSPGPNGATPSPDHFDFDLDKLRLPTDYTELTNLKKPLLVVPVRKPGRDEFVRVHPDPKMSIRLSLLRNRGRKGGAFLLPPEMHVALPEEGKPHQLYLTCSTVSEIAIWPVRLPEPDGHTNDWWTTAEQAAHIARENWIRLRSGEKRYDVIV